MHRVCGDACCPPLQRTETFHRSPVPPSPDEQGGMMGEMENRHNLNFRLQSVGL
jgi:hypothetical protein